MKEKNYWIRKKSLNPKALFSYVNNARKKIIWDGHLKFEKSIKMTSSKYGICYFFCISQYLEKKLCMGDEIFNRFDENTIADVDVMGNYVIKTINKISTTTRWTKITLAKSMILLLRQSPDENIIVESHKMAQYIAENLNFYRKKIYISKFDDVCNESLWKSI